MAASPALAGRAHTRTSHSPHNPGRWSGGRFPHVREDEIQEDDMNVRKIAAVGVMAAALVGTSATGAFAASNTSTKSTTSTTCLPEGHDDVWPTWTDGK